MSPDLVVGLIFTFAVLAGVFLITVGFARAEHRTGARPGGSEAGGVAIWGGSDGGAHCSPGDSGGGCDGGGGGS